LSSLAERIGALNDASAPKSIESVDREIVS
jgi:hypothetical protein